MPRRERQVQGRALVASAKNISFRKSKDKVANSKLRVGESWQHLAWDFFDLVSEYRQGCSITGSLLSRAKLVVVERTVDVEGKPSWKPTTNPVAQAALQDLYGGEEGQVEMLRNLGVHFSVAGGCYLVGPTKPQDVADPSKWIIAAATELAKTGDKWRLNGKELDDVFVVELWKPHPKNPRHYDSPTRAILPVLNLLVQLMKRSAAQIDSRLTGNGVVLFPSEIEFPAAPVRRNHGDPATPADALQSGNLDGLIDMLARVGSEAMEDQSSPAATMPVFGTVPGEYLGKTEQLKFWSDLDAAMPALELALIRRIALGMDMPPEVLLGNAGSNHWNAWLSDENSVKIHAEPLLRIITLSLTTGYLRVALDGEVDDVTAFAIAADTSQMRMRPNRSKEAIELYEHGELSAVAMRRENGFDEADAPSEEERKRMLLFKVAGGSTTPELVNAALRKEGVDLGIIVTDNRPPAEARPDPSIAEHPVRELPQRPQESSRAAANATALVFASEQMVDRALQRCGNRIKTKFGLRGTDTPANRLYRTAPITLADLDDLLTDAWASTETVSDLIDPAKLARALDLYTRALLMSRREPSRTSLAAALKLLLDETAA
ncbi:portal protein [Microbacterium phage Fransoyer]|nr:portal protein [Microbacterium phage Fransoyer]